MQHIGDQYWFSPSDLGKLISCEHLVSMELAIANGEQTVPRIQNAYADLIRRKGEEHERKFLEHVLAAGHSVDRIDLGNYGDFMAAAKVTVDAMRRGAAYIYQAVFVKDKWRGIADFLERVDRPSALGAWSYQVIDTKLARHPHPQHALQLCFYSEVLAASQGIESDIAYVILGTATRAPIRIADVAAYYRRVRERFEAAVASRPVTEPYPCEHCSLCDFRLVCSDKWDREDHLNRVAGITRDQISRLSAAGIGTLARLAETPPACRVPKIQEATLEKLQDQASLQVQSHVLGKVAWHTTTIESGRGLGTLPPLSRGDIILDFEGHPFFEPGRGLEFLFGVLTVEEPEPQYKALWAHDFGQERAALEGFIDLVTANLTTYPDLHVYHFGAHEPSTIKRLMGEYATRELEVDALLRRGTFIDLHTIFRQSLRAGVQSYSLKELEPIFGFSRSADVRSGMQAILQYEEWMRTGRDVCLTRVADYNQEDCRSTFALLKWLHGLRPSNLPWPQPPELRPVSAEAQQALNARHLLREQLLHSAESGTPRWLIAELLEYHQREARPAWWWYFERLGMTPEELVDDSESIGCLSPAVSVRPEPYKKSLIHTLTFPPQEHKLSPGPIEDPATGKSAGEILEIDDAKGTLRLLRGPKFAQAPLPRALICGGPYDDRQQRDAISRAAESFLKEDGHYPAIRAILGREFPRFTMTAANGRVQTTDLNAIKSLALALDSSYLFIQGPPGAGKTWTGARIVVHLIANGKRVGIAAQSHKAIHNLLDEIESVALNEHVQFLGMKKSTNDNPESSYEGQFIKSESDPVKVVQKLPQLRLVAGTAWLFSRADLDNKLDYLVIDEAGQVSLADAIAIGTSARNVILLGDPLQLAQVSQGTHPPGCNASVLEHVLGDEPTIPEDRGVFLERSFRMHPDVCSFISEIVYASRLHSDVSAARRSTSFGTGIRFCSVEHQGNRSASDEEVEAIAGRIAHMLKGSFTDSAGVSRQLGEADFMVVAPYNAQVRRLRARLPSGVRVGTVDKFQGQEAPIVFFSMATSSGEDVPRDLTFLFSRNRLNVAISRAQCLAFLVCSPRLLEARCSSIEEMALVNALCRLVEYAESQDLTR